MSNLSIGFIGGGKMARAIAAGLLASGYDGAAIRVSEPSAGQRDVLLEDLPGVRIVDNNSDVALHSSCLVLAVKPQIMAAVCRDLAPPVQEARPLIISIAAGIRCTDIDAWLGGGLPIVRVMPNQPALLRQGVSGIFANEQVSDAERARAETIMAAVGRVVRVARETDIDVVTAISGSGPAYFFLLIDMLARTAAELGLDEESANILAIDTASGAAALAAASDVPMETLIASVRSPGGTTAAALDSLDQQNIRDIFARALTAARNRAVELADRAHNQN